MATLEIEKLYTMIAQLAARIAELEKKLRLYENGSLNVFIPQKNPMQISSIVENLLKFVPKGSLCTQRLVCGLWNDEAIHQIRARISFKLSKSNLDKIHTFMEFAESSFAGFRKFYLDLNGCRTYHRYMCSIDDILIRHSIHITQLVIRFEVNSVWSIQDFRRLLLGLNADNLQNLQAWTCPYQFFQVDSIFAPGNRPVFHQLKTITIARLCQPRISNIGFFVDLFHSAPNLESIYFHGRDGYDDFKSTFPDGVGALIQLRPGNLKKVYMRAPVSNENVTKLIASNLDMDLLHLFSFRLFNVQLTMTAPPIIHPLALNYRDTYCVTLVEKLRDIMKDAFTAAQLTNGNKVSCMSQLRIFQSTLNNLLIP